ncbi:MAG: hypothetical protein ACFE9I_05985 [Candidatus Hermodarchaeota archaeon]
MFSSGLAMFGDPDGTKIEFRSPVQFPARTTPGCIPSNVWPNSCARRLSLPAFWSVITTFEVASPESEATPPP